MTEQISFSWLGSNVAQRWRKQGVSAAAIADYLGPAVYSALFRGESAAVRRACDPGTDLGFYICAALLHDVFPIKRWHQQLGDELVDALVNVGFLDTYTPSGRDGVRLTIDIRLVLIGGTERWVFSDADASMPGQVPGREHVLGVGAASLSLAQSVPHTPVSSLLDIGTGCAVQLSAQAECAHTLVGTDINPRALDFAAATCAANELGDNVELLEGSWFEPVAGRRFERIVSNPPFVVGPAVVDHVYRDSGLSADGASKLMVSAVPEYLTMGGTAHLVAAWLHTEGEPWQARVASWLPEHGVAAWFIQRDVVDPAMYVGTWLRDESLDPADPAAEAKAVAWLDFFDSLQVTGVGFGFVAIQRIDPAQPSEILAEELSHELSDPLGEEVAEFFVRSQWLRHRSAAEIADSRFTLRPGVALERISVVDAIGAGFAPAALRITRTEGPRWSHEVDEHVAAIVNGLRPDGLSLGETAALYFLAQGIDIDDAEEDIMPQVVAIVVDLVRHGIVLPADLIA